jgi:kynurenine formamidase
MCLPGTVEKVRQQAPPDRARRVDRRTVLLGAAGAAAAAALPGAALAGRPAKGRFADLTHVFTEGFPVYTGDEPARETLFSIPANGFYSQKWTFGEHSGTHMDAPGHFKLGGRLSPQITPQELLVPIVVIDITAKAATNPDAMVTVDDLRSFERGHGRIPDGALVAMNSGWASKVGNTAAFKGGPPGDYHFPGFGNDAAMWLAAERDVTAIGVDTLSLDPGNSTTFAVHVNFLATDRYGLENLNNLDKVPPRGALAYVGLIPWEEGSGGPCRVIANW